MSPLSPHLNLPPSRGKKIESPDVYDVFVVTRLTNTFLIPIQTVECRRIVNEYFVDDAGIDVALLFHGSDIRLPALHAQAETDSPFRDQRYTATDRLEEAARANRALIDGLTRQGVPPESADDVIAAAALEVTPEYVAELQAAGLKLAKLDDAVACRALEVDADYVRSLAAAGYHADAEQVVAMKAVGVTPEYARRMTAAAQD